MQQDSVNEITEMEVKVDPMLFLQCSLDDDYRYESSSETLTDTDSLTIILKDSKDNDVVDDPDKSLNSNMNPKRSDCESNNLNLNRNLSTNRILQNNHKNIKIEDIDDNKEKSKKIITEPKNSNASSEGESTENTNLLRYRCPICNKMISTKGNLKVHLETHRPKGKYACDICGRV